MFPLGRRSPLPEWAIPLIYSLSALFAGLLLPRIENRLVPHLVAPVSASVALTILSSITSGMIALTGIVFSLAFVMVQFSAVAYSPRLVTWLARDPVIWHAIGIFTATFLYAIGAMAWIDRAGSGKVPLLSTWTAIILMLASVGMFVSMIERMGLLQVGRMLVFTGHLGRRVIEQMYPPIDSPPALALPGELPESTLAQVVNHSGGPLALQTIDIPKLLALAEASGGNVEVAVSVGDTLISGMPLVRVFGGRHPIADEEWRRAFQMGSERTFDQDPKYAIRLLVDIAIRALSPAINDPTTAVQALNQIQDQLLRLGRRRLEIGAVRDAAGVLRLVVPNPSWEDLLHLALEEIRFCGATSIQVMRRMRALISDLIAVLPIERHPALSHQLERLNATIARSFPDNEAKLDASVEDRQGLGVPRKPERAKR